VPYLSVVDNVLAPSLAHPSASARERALSLISRFGLQERAHHVPAELSTGERQRTALARALLNQPKLLLADEPTGNLDEQNGRLVLGFLADFARQGGAVLLVTHDAKVADYAARIVRMKDGQVI
jgi:ABC-type lipoprotein export system ATPase subunit